MSVLRYGLLGYFRIWEKRGVPFFLFEKALILWLSFHYLIHNYEQNIGFY